MMEAEVSIYIQKIKTYLKNNQEAWDYFIGDSDENEFFKQLEVVSEKNLETNGQPELTKEQFELLRVAIKVDSIKNQRLFYSDDKLFMYLDDFPGICMN